MDILIAAHGFPPTHSAGAERRAERMAKWLTRNGHYVEVFVIESARDPSFRVESTEQDGFMVHRQYFDVYDKSDGPLTRLYDYPPITDEIDRVLRQRHFDVVHIVSGYLIGNQAVEAAQRNNLPVALTLTEFWFMCARLNLVQATQALCNGPESHAKCARCLMEYKRRYRLPSEWAPSVMDSVWPLVHWVAGSRMQEAVERRHKVLKRALEAVDLVICPSHHLRDKFAEFDFDTRNFRFIRQGLYMPPAHLSESPREKSGPLRLGYIGQIKIHKGVDLLIEAILPLLENQAAIELDLWGPEQENPRYVEAMRKRSERFPNQIRWNGSYTGDRTWDVLSNMDVLIMPSRWYENSPNVILEAYAMGIPVIATNRGGMAELITHEKSGLLFEMDDVVELREQIQRLLNEPQLLPQLREGVPPVKTIDEEMVEIVSAYHTLVKKPDPS